MASDIRISELNEINVNSDINEIIVNSRESSNDVGVSKKIQVSNLLTANIVKADNIANGSITNAKLAGKVVLPGNIADKSITNNQIANNTIGNGLLATDSVDNRVLNEDCSYTALNFTADNCITALNASIVGRLSVPTGSVSLNGLNYTFPQIESPRRFLQTDGVGNLSWQEAVPGDGTALVFSDVAPVGTVLPYAGSSETSVPDDKWINLYATRRFLGSEYPELRDLLGTTWGPRQDSDGTPNPTGDYYALPDLRARTIVGAGEGNDGTDSCTASYATCGGAFNHVLTYSQMPAHRHVSPLGENTNQGNWRWGNCTVGSCGAGSRGGIDYDNRRYGYTTYAGADSVENGVTTSSSPTTPHNNTQPYAAMSYIIKAKPDDIQQYDMNIGPGLSALDALGGQTANVDLSSSEIGLKVTDDFQFDGSNRLEISSTYTNTVIDTIDVGRPIQYVNNHIDTTHRYSKVADTDLLVTQLNTAIALKDANSKVYITAMITAESYTHNGVWKLFRKVGAVETEIGSNIGTGGSNRRGIATGMYDGGNDTSTPNNVYIQYMDTPGSTNVEYLFKWNSDGTGSNYFTLNGARSTSTGEDYEQASSNVNLVEIGG